FAFELTVSESVALLLPPFGSVTPTGVAMLAVLLIVPAAAPSTVPVRVKITLPPEGRLTLWVMFPDPLGAHVPPPAPAQVQVAPVIAAGTVSVTVAPVTADGPALEA